MKCEGRLYNAPNHSLLAGQLKETLFLVATDHLGN